MLKFPPELIETNTLRLNDLWRLEMLDTALGMGWRRKARNKGSPSYGCRHKGLCAMDIWTPLFLMVYMQLYALYIQTC